MCWSPPTSDRARRDLAPSKLGPIRNPSWMKQKADLWEVLNPPQASNERARERKQVWKWHWRPIQKNGTSFLYWFFLVHKTLVMNCNESVWSEGYEFYLIYRCLKQVGEIKNGMFLWLMALWAERIWMEDWVSHTFSF